MGKHPLSIFLRGDFQERSQFILCPYVESLIFYENSKIFKLFLPHECIDQSEANDFTTYCHRLAGALIQNLSEHMFISLPIQHAFADFLTFSHENANEHFIAGEPIPTHEFFDSSDPSCPSEKLVAPYEHKVVSIRTLLCLKKVKGVSIITGDSYSPAVASSLSEYHPIAEAWLRCIK